MILFLFESYILVALYSLKNFFNFEFIFIFRKNFFDREFVEHELKKLKIKNYKFILLSNLTSGQSETILKAKKCFKENIQENFLVYNIDTHVNFKEVKKSDLKLFDGFIYAVKVSGTHWSFIKPKNNFVEEVSEKRRISNYGTIGLYYFNNFNYFLDTYKKNKLKVKKEYKETYVAPFYNFMISDSKKIGYKILNKKFFVPLGTPEEVFKFDKNFKERTSK